MPRTIKSKTFKEDRGTDKENQNLFKTRKEKQNDNMNEIGF